VYSGKSRERRVDLEKNNEIIVSENQSDSSGGLPVLNNYTIKREIGSGGMAVVYEAIDDRLQRTVALKMLHPHLCRDSGATERFKREAFAAARMDHPNIVRIYDYIIENSAHYIVMEHVPGTDLESILKNKGKLDINLIIEIMGQIAASLAEAHSKGILHRDIKPSNILIHQQGRAMLTDFGLACRTFDDRLTTSNAVAGTPSFMSPEQISGKELTRASDIYSWAVTFHCLLTGKLPYKSQAFPDIIPEIQQGKIVIDEHLHEKISGVYYELIKRCLDVDPANRIPDGVSLREIISGYKKNTFIATDIDKLLKESVLESLANNNMFGGHTSKTNVFNRPIAVKKKMLIIPIIIALVGITVVVLYSFKKTDSAASTYISQYGQKNDTIIPSPVIENQDTAIVNLEQDSLNPEAIVTAPKIVEKKVVTVNTVKKDSGDLFIYCEPWANVFIDNVEIGSTPFEKPVRLKKGIHILTLVNKYCTTLVDTVNVRAGIVIRKRYTLQLVSP
jgi:serine/threonine-protein kinase